MEPNMDAEVPFITNVEVPVVDPIKKQLVPNYQYANAGFIPPLPASFPLKHRQSLLVAGRCTGKLIVRARREAIRLSNHEKMSSDRMKCLTSVGSAFIVARPKSVMVGDRPVVALVLTAAHAVTRNRTYKEHDPVQIFLCMEQCIENLQIDDPALFCHGRLYEAVVWGIGEKTALLEDPVTGNVHEIPGDVAVLAVCAGAVNESRLMDLGMDKYMLRLEQHDDILIPSLPPSPVSPNESFSMVPRTVAAVGYPSSHLHAHPPQGMASEYDTLFPLGEPDPLAPANVRDYFFDGRSKCVSVGNIIGQSAEGFAFNASANREEVV
ncbi:hypothetical protein HK104_009301 [Borealophlyctis nickersoniae]|nr:hypothetical protein HK104_009301 [Borealophlyctis nickersoniae]